MSNNENNNIEGETGIAESFQHAGEAMMDAVSNAGNALASFVGAKTEETKEEAKSEMSRNERDTELENAKDASTMTESIEHLGKAASSQASAFQEDMKGEKENMKAEQAKNDMENEKENAKDAASDAGNSMSETLSEKVKQTTEYFTNNNQKDTKEAHAEEKEKHWDNAKDDTKDMSERANSAVLAGEEAALEAAHMLE